MIYCKDLTQVDNKLLNTDNFIVIFRISDFAEHLSYFIIKNKSIEKYNYYLIYSNESDKKSLSDLKNDIIYYNINLFYYGDNYSKHYLIKNKNFLFENLIISDKLIIKLWENFLKLPLTFNNVKNI